MQQRDFSASAGEARCYFYLVLHKKENAGILKDSKQYQKELGAKNTFSHTTCAFAATSKAAIGFADRRKK